MADDARIGYPAVRFGTPDMQYHAWMFGMRAGMESMLTGDSCSGTEASALATHSKTSRSFIKDLGDEGVTGSLTKRDTAFGDYRTTEPDVTS